MLKLVKPYKAFVSGNKLNFQRETRPCNSYTSSFDIGDSSRGRNESGANTWEQNRSLKII